MISLSICVKIWNLKSHILSNLILDWFYLLKLFSFSNHFWEIIFFRFLPKFCTKTWSKMFVFASRIEWQKHSRLKLFSHVYSTPYDIYKKIFRKLYFALQMLFFTFPKNAVSYGQGPRQLRTNELFFKHSVSEKLKAICDCPIPLNIVNWYR